MKTRFMIRLLVLGGICTSALTACDRRELLAPGVKPPGRARAGLTEPVSLGSQLLPPPPNTGGAPGPSVSLGSVPARTWVVLQVNGSVSGEWNPDCNERPPAWPCGEGAPAQNYTGGADPYAPVTITYTYNQFGTHTGRVLLRGTGAGSAIGLYSNDFPSTLEGFLKVNTLTSWDPNFGIIVPSYYKLSGGYTVTATLVPSPFQVKESAPDASGMVTYTAEPLYGLNFINPPLDGHLPAGDLVWKFFPGDSLPDEPDFSWPGWYVYECERKTVCNYRPSQPGRMQAEAMVEMQRAYVRSKRSGCDSGSGSLCTPQSNFTLRCRALAPVGSEPSDSAVTVGRTGTVTCETEPAGPSVQIKRWQFAGGVRPDGSPVTITREGADRSARTWAGVMVASGKISVSALVGRDSVTREVNVTVTPRVWKETAPTPVYDIIDTEERCPGGIENHSIDCYTQTPPQRLGDLGRTHNPSTLRERLGRRAAQVSDGGPNNGFAYVGGTGSPIVYVSLHTHLNPVLFNPHAPLFAHVERCTQPVMLEWVRSHERKHAQLILDWINEGLANTLIEPQVYYESLEEMRTWLDGAVNADVGAWVTVTMGDGNHLLHPELWDNPCHSDELTFATPNSAH
ncbi:MAG TPA: hypothetical protein VFJ16_30135 [Longimicrobium sp.]|nr:hypothetical protein [Longimicrobium sp.]